MAKLNDSLIEIAPAANISTDTGNPHYTIGRKADAAANVVTTTKSIMAYVKGLFTMFEAPSQDSTDNVTSRDVIGSKTDSEVLVVGSEASVMSYTKRILTEVKQITQNGMVGPAEGMLQQPEAGSLGWSAQKIDAREVDGLLGVKDSLAYKVHEIERHIHHTPQWYGFVAPDLVRAGFNPFQTVAGNDVYGTELVLYNALTADIINSEYLDLSDIRVTAVGTINILTFIKFMRNTIVSTVNATTKADDDTIRKTSHGLSNGDRIYVSAINNAFNAVNNICYVVNGEVDSGVFQLSFTLGGAPIIIGGGDGTIVYHEVTQNDLSELYVRRASAVPDTSLINIVSRRIPTADLISVKSKGSGATNTVDFLVGLHTYEG